MTDAAALSTLPAKRWSVITGCFGGIGQALLAEFRNAGFSVAGVDLMASAPPDALLPDGYVCCDLDRLAQDESYRLDCMGQLLTLTSGSVSVLVNNAAWQVVKPIERITAADWVKTNNVNVVAPFLLTQGLLPALEAAAGSVVNMASIHAQLSKPEFSAYAASKAALVGLTKVMAVELGGRVRVNAVCPAAVATPMLVAGFQGREESYRQLSEMHPAGRIGQPEEVARLALLLSDERLGFMTGAVVSIDGAIGARLHDPI